MSLRALTVVAVVSTGLVAAACAAGGAQRPTQPGVTAGSISSCGGRGESNFYFTGQSTALEQTALDEIANIISHLHGCSIERVVITGTAPDRDLAARRVETVAAALAAGGWDRSGFETNAVASSATSGGVVQPLSERVNLLIVTGPAN